jgi:hypothetical protein
VADDRGVPLEGNHKVSVRLFQTLTGGAAECVAGPADVAFQKGRFRVEVAACVAKLQARADLFAELAVDDESKPFPRSKVGAVPFAMEAQHAINANLAKSAEKATTADTAANAVNAQNAMSATNAVNATNAANATGALKTQVDALSGRIAGFNMYAKGGNNGTSSCNVFCNDVNSQWAGAKGFCLGAQDTDSKVFYDCNAAVAGILGHLANQLCYCGRPD